MKGRKKERVKNLVERRGGKKCIRMSKKKGEYKKRVQNLEEKRGGKKGLRMLKKKGEDIERVKNLEEMKGRKNKGLKVHKHENFFVTFFAETETIWSQGPVTRDF